MKPDFSRHDVALKSLEIFLVNQGARILEPTNEWEVLRFRSIDGVGVLYTDKRGNISWVGAAKEAMNAYHNEDTTWNIEKKGRRKMTNNSKLLVSRDGIKCFYCGKPTHETDRTVEHLLSIADGGGNNMKNLVLAHRDCNLEAANLGVFEKVKLRERKHSEL